MWAGTLAPAGGEGWVRGKVLAIRYNWMEHEVHSTDVVACQRQMICPDNAQEPTLVNGNVTDCPDAALRCTASVNSIYFTPVAKSVRRSSS